jgi:hypothetical protein
MTNGLNEEPRKSKLMQASHLIKNIDDYIEIFNIASSNDSSIIQGARAFNIPSDPKSMREDQRSASF